MNDSKALHVLAVVVDNEPGILSRISGLFSARGYNIESLTVSETEHEKHLSRLTIATRATDREIEQIIAQIERLIPVHRVVSLGESDGGVVRELALLKVVGKGDPRVETLRLADAFRARVVDATTESFILEITGKPSKIDSFISLILPLGLVEVTRTGITAIKRGEKVS